MFEIITKMIDLLMLGFNQLYNFNLELYTGINIKLGTLVLTFCIIIGLITYVFNALGGGDSN